MSVCVCVWLSADSVGSYFFLFFVYFYGNDSNFKFQQNRATIEGAPLANPLCLPTSPSLLLLTLLHPNPPFP